MDFHIADELAEHRDAARAWADANVDPEWVHEQHRTGCFQTAELHARLAHEGILGAGWPSEYGGTETDPHYARAVFDECARRGLHADAWASSCMIMSTIAHVGSEEQKQEYVGGALRGELLYALGYTEPDSGSDVAAAKTSAVRDGTEWVLNGQKMFTSSAQVCSHVFLLARTNPEAPKHKGLSLFMVPLDAPGVEIRPIHTLGDQVTNATFYTDVRVPESALIGEVDNGWSVMKVALVFERGVSSPASIEQTLARDLARWAKDNGRFGDPLTAERIGRIAVEEQVTRLLELRTRWQVSKGELPGVEGSMHKLFFTEAAQRQHSDALDILGMEGLLEPGASGAPADGAFERDFRAAVVMTLYGGSSEILREIVAERHLGLPRNRPSK